MTNAMVPYRDDSLFMPVMEIESAIVRRNFVVKFAQEIMVKDKDYGVVPGTGAKPSLLKPGAEKLVTVFGWTPVFVPITVVEDWTGEEHKDEPFFYYRYRCELHRSGNLIATSEGSCNSWEKKYRYRSASRVCPDCGAGAIIKGKAEYGGGWLCFKKSGGCGAKFGDNDKRITDQPTGQVANPDIADQVNTIQKMAQKRALVASVLIAANASEFFTQDVEDMVIDGEWSMSSVMEPQPEQPKPQRKPDTTQDVEFRKPAPKSAPDVNGPTDEELAILSTWRNADDAYAWAINDIKTCKDIFEAKGSLTKIVNANGGRFTKDNAAQVYLGFLRRQFEKRAMLYAAALPVEPNGEALFAA